MPLFFLLSQFFEGFCCPGKRGANSISPPPMPVHSQYYVAVQPLRDMKLQAFTLCFWIQTQNRGSQTILAYRTQERDNELVVTVGSAVGLWLGGHFVEFPLHHKSEEWLHYCVAWASHSGAANLWLNGAVGREKYLQRGYMSQAGGMVVLGKDRDELLGIFSNGFSGWMSHVSLWSWVISHTDIRVLSFLDGRNVLKSMIIIMQYVYSLWLCI
uniref:Pentraxin family member n=1 Tax=Chelonoidis abingdonii TaxID=106734 RepID=A0A8C0IY53_CHEAB